MGKYKLYKPKDDKIFNRYTKFGYVRKNVKDARQGKPSRDIELTSDQIERFRLLVHYLIKRSLDENGNPTDIKIQIKDDEGFEREFFRLQPFEKGSYGEQEEELRLMNTRDFYCVGGKIIELSPPIVKFTNQNTGKEEWEKKYKINYGEYELEAVSYEIEEFINSKIEEAYLQIEKDYPIQLNEKKAIAFLPNDLVDINEPTTVLNQQEIELQERITHSERIIKSLLKFLEQDIVIKGYDVKTGEIDYEIK